MKHEEYLDKWWYERPRYGTLEDALNHDAETIKRLLKGHDKEKSQAINEIVQHIIYEYLDSTKTSKDFEDFSIRYLGKDKYDEVVRMWLKEKGNQFANQVGMPELVRPMAIFMTKE